MLDIDPEYLSPTLSSRGPGKYSDFLKMRQRERERERESEHASE